MLALVSTKIKTSFHTTIRLPGGIVFSLRVFHLRDSDVPLLHGMELSEMVSSSRHVKKVLFILRL